MLRTLQSARGFSERLNSASVVQQADCQFYSIYSVLIGIVVMRRSCLQIRKRSMYDEVYAMCDLMEQSLWHSTDGSSSTLISGLVQPGPPLDLLAN